MSNNEPVVRILRVLEYVGPRDAVYKDLEKRYIKGSAGLPVCAGKGTLKEIFLAEVDDIVEDGITEEERTSGRA